MNSKLLVPLVFSLCLGSGFIIAAEPIKAKTMTVVKFRTEGGKEIRCLVHPADRKAVGEVGRGERVDLYATGPVQGSGSTLIEFLNPVSAGGGSMTLNGGHADNVDNATPMGAPTSP